MVTKVMEIRYYIGLTEDDDRICVETGPHAFVTPPTAPLRREDGSVLYPVPKEVAEAYMAYQDAAREDLEDDGDGFPLADDNEYDPL
jgi:hypothetical protein